MRFSLFTVATALLLSLAQATPVPQAEETETRLGSHNCFACSSNGTPNTQIESKPPTGGINPDAWCTSTCLLCNAGSDNDDACAQLKKYCQNY
ncbi:hypothetical protein TWF569_010585 [Orbilia oligospora]|uniref:Uncharacterized protein n=1 Tax=Orbilia oligospora TaxID=2813651 RepID=A0A7C8NW82_ORBOL|nr:hypothetical protein TWF706_005087 [Orbilia oligospora]KAF3102965.1 hypothetical protein TWF706_005087 [Orbilia oligospora]KAF3103251.1 hypothetical protein TWF103_007248 [Orbilia oligospora]KAF3103252.1 hypothetical protein TWF103_007248 [Orbilia oligospora]KAF3109149.1 hypothetical protein TWF102_009924 [Orbilia oligospora]